MTTPLIDRVCGSNFSHQHLDAHGYAGLATVELVGDGHYALAPRPPRERSLHAIAAASALTTDAE